MSEEQVKEMRISFILPVVDEVEALKETVIIILELVGEYVCEILIITGRITTKNSLETIRQLEIENKGVIRVLQQEMQGLGGAMRKALDEVAGTYVMLMASDLETDPKLIMEFIRRMERGDCDIVAASRWLVGGGFEGYGRIKVILNWGFQRIFRVLYGVRLTDLTFAYRLYRREALEGIKWEETKHSFLLECLLKPLRLGYRVVEIPCEWKKRTEGESHGSIWQMFKYVSLAVRVRFMGLEKDRQRKKY